jgi:hypothetical protein
MFHDVDGDNVDSQALEGGSALSDIDVLWTRVLIESLMFKSSANHDAKNESDGYALDNMPQS